MSPSVEPFNEAKYRVLMDGLECSEIKFSELEIDNEKYRLDSEFYLKKYIKSYAEIKNVPHERLCNILKTLTDFHANGSYETIAKHFQLLDDKNYAYMVRTTDLERENYVDDVKYITRDSYEFLAKSKVFGGELLINKIGSPGRTFIMPDLGIPVSLGMNLFLLRIKAGVKVNESIVYLFLQTNIGKNIISRKINGTVPLTIDKEAIKSLYVPLFSSTFVERLTKILENKQVLQNTSKELYSEAEKILIKSINIDIKNNSYSIKSINNSFRLSGRLDAEYYQPKYDLLFNKLNELKTFYLGGENGLVSIQKSIEPGSEYYQEEGISFIRVSDVDKFEIREPDIKLPCDIVTNVENLYPKKDTILFSKDGSVGIAHKVQEDMEAITSGAILHLAVKNTDVILPDYLTLVLNSTIVQLQAERDSNGAIIQHWKPSDIEKVVIPVLDMDVQKEVAEKVQESFRLRRESKRLLEFAVKAVEKAIETDENTAIVWLESQV